MADEFFILDPHNADERAAYEYAFYHAYANLTDNRLVRDLWLWDDAHERLQTRIPYQDQKIFCWRNDKNELLAALAASLNPNQFQAGMFGFKRDLDSPDRKTCEILNMITTPQHRQSAIRTFSTFVTNYCFRSLRDMGYDIGYSTCTQRRKRGYVFLGATVLGETMINQESRFLMTWDFKELLNAPPRR